MNTRYKRNVNMHDTHTNDLFKTLSNGTNPTLISKMRSGFLLMGLQQFIPGYVVLFADPPIASINDLSLAERALFLEDMSIAGDALLNCTEAYRINYNIAGNSAPVLHAHIHPRYMHETETYRKGSIQQYGDDVLNSVPFDIEAHKTLMNTLCSEVKKLLKQYSS